MGQHSDNGGSGPRGGRMVAAMATVATGLMPTAAAATPLEGAPAVAVYTASAVGAVLVLALVAGIGLYAAAGLGLIGRRGRVVVRRRLRVAFGVTFLLAAVTPYVALNFSVGTVLSFLAAAGLVVAGWVWGAARRNQLESESTATSGSSP